MDDDLEAHATRRSKHTARSHCLGCCVCLQVIQIHAPHLYALGCTASVQPCMQYGARTQVRTDSAAAVFSVSLVFFQKLNGALK
jgi:hypothetical protein